MDSLTPLSLSRRAGVGLGGVWAGWRWRCSQHGGEQLDPNHKAASLHLLSLLMLADFFFNIVKSFLPIKLLFAFARS